VLLQVAVPSGSVGVGSSTDSSSSSASSSSLPGSGSAGGLTGAVYAGLKFSSLAMRIAGDVVTSVKDDASRLLKVTGGLGPRGESGGGVSVGMATSGKAGASSTPLTWTHPGGLSRQDHDVTSHGPCAAVVLLSPCHVPVCGHCTANVLPVCGHCTGSVLLIVAVLMVWLGKQLLPFIKALFKEPCMQIHAVGRIRVLARDDKVLKPVAVPACCVRVFELHVEGVM